MTLRAYTIKGKRKNDISFERASKERIWIWVVFIITPTVKTEKSYVLKLFFIDAYRFTNRRVHWSSYDTWTKNHHLQSFVHIHLHNITPNSGGCARHHHRTHFNLTNKQMEQIVPYKEEGFVIHD